MTRQDGQTGTGQTGTRQRAKRLDIAWDRWFALKEEMGELENGGTGGGPAEDHLEKLFGPERCPECDEALTPRTLKLREGGRPKIQCRCDQGWGRKKEQE